MKKFCKYLFLLFLTAFFCTLSIYKIVSVSELSRLNETIVGSYQFRCQHIDEKASVQISDLQLPGEVLAVYWLETDFGSKKSDVPIRKLAVRRKRWEREEAWNQYLSACQAVWDDLKYFPVAESPEKAVTFENSWMFERTYKGERKHEGTDIMPSVDESGIFPVVSMTDGTIENIGWLELGGWRIGIRAPRGAYFYYAHLDSYADLHQGDSVKAGDFLGYMGDSGYGKREGTTGKFPVHLHLGIYLNENEKEISINPYPALNYLKDRTIKADF